MLPNRSLCLLLPSSALRCVVQRYKRRRLFSTECLVLAIRPAEGTDFSQSCNDVCFNKQIPSCCSSLYRKQPGSAQNTPCSIDSTSLCKKRETHNFRRVRLATSWLMYTVPCAGVFTFYNLGPFRKIKDKRQKRKRPQSDEFFCLGFFTKENRTALHGFFFSTITYIGLLFVISSL